MIRRVVVAFDFSDPSRRALAYVLDMGLSADATVDVVTVVPDKDADAAIGSLPIGEVPGERDLHLRSLHDQLEHELLERRKEAGPRLMAHALRGTPEKALLALAKHVSADMVVVGMSEKTLFEKLFAGSVSRELLTQHRFPVLLVP